MRCKLIMHETRRALSHDEAEIAMEALINRWIAPIRCKKIGSLTLFI